MNKSMFRRKSQKFEDGFSDIRRQRRMSLGDLCAVMFCGEDVATPLVLTPTATEVAYDRGILKAPLSLLDDIPVASTSTAKTSRAVDVFLPEQVLLKRDVPLKRARKRDLARIARLNLIRNTPFDAKEVCWALELAPSGSLEFATQWIARVEDLDRLSTNLKRYGYQLRKTSIRTKNPQQPIFLNQREPRKSNTWKLLNIFLALLAISLFSLIRLLPAFEAQERLTVRQNTISTLEIELREVRKKVNAFSEKKERQKLYLVGLEKFPSVSNSILQATEALDDSVTLSLFQKRGTKIILEGETKNGAARLVLALNSFGSFNEVRLEGPIVRLSTGAERFKLSAQWSEET